MPSEVFEAQAALLVRALTYVAAETCFALKGGTAINLFVRNLPRLSVDIDLVYLPIEDRETSLLGIRSALARIAQSVRKAIGALQPRPVELWLRELPLSPKSRTHVRSLLHGLVEFAMWAGLLDISRNPISLVQNKGATRKVRKARSLTVEQFHALLTELHEPFATLALLSVCLGLRISEALGLKWEDVDWLGECVSIRRGIVEQVVGDVKTEGSARTFSLTSELLERLKTWKQRSEFSNAEDWIFASPIKIGRLPYSYTGVWRELVRAAAAAKIGHLGTHAFRHTYRSWLDAVGTPVAVQQKMMRHADIRTTFNIYGDVVTDEMTTAGARVAKLAFEGIGAQTERKGS